MTLATRVKERRKELKMTQVTLAELTGVSQQAINRIESGVIARPRYLLEMSIALDCDTYYCLLASVVAATHPEVAQAFYEYLPECLHLRYHSPAPASHGLYARRCHNPVHSTSGQNHAQ